MRHSDEVEKLIEDHRKEIQDLKELHAQEFVEYQTQREKDVDHLQRVIKSKEEEMKFLQHNHNHDIMELKQSHTLHLQSTEDDKEEWRKKYKYAKDQLKRAKKRIEELEGNEVAKSKSVRRAKDEMRGGRRSSDVTINWNIRGKPAPQPLHREDSESVFCNDTLYIDTLYIRPASKKTVFAYHPRLDEWKEMPRCPHKYSTLAHINSTVIVIGGRTGALDYLNCIYYLTEEGGGCQWKEASFYMPTKRCSPMVVTSGLSLVVAGGEGEESRLRRV